MKAYERGYLRARAGISADKDGDIFGQKRRYLPAKPHKGLTDKVHIVVIIPPTGYYYNKYIYKHLTYLALPHG